MPSQKSKAKQNSPAERRLFPVGLILMAAGIAVHIGFIIYFNFTQDDAFITFRYAANFLDGHGLVYNIGERVEGYTNFLWLLFVILGKLSGAGFITFSKILSAMFGVGTIIFSYLTGLRIFERKSYLSGLSCLVLGAVYSFAYWTVAGLETAAFSFMVIAAIYFYLKNSHLTAAFLVLATLLRPEGGLMFLFILIYEILRHNSLSRFAIVLGFIYIIGLLPYAVFKWTYFGGILPNPFYAKTNFSLGQIQNGLEYGGLFFWHYLGAGLFVLPLLISIKKWSRPLKIIIAFLTIYMLYIVMIGGDVLKVHRFFVPLYALLIPVIVFGFVNVFRKKYLFWPAVAVFLTWQLLVPRDHVDTYHRAEKALIHKMNNMMTNLLENDSSDFSLAVSTVGLVGYRLMGHTVIDLLGLTDSTIARHPEPPVEELKTTWKEEKYNSAYVLSRQPDYIMFSTEFKPSAPAERALFLYSQFLDNYRTIGFFFDGGLHAIFKRYFPIKGNIVRDVDPNFPQHIHTAMNLWQKEDYPEAISYIEKALELCPEPKYPYLLYYMANSIRKMEDFRTSYYMLRLIAQQDTLVYEVYKDLFVFENNVLDRPEEAMKYRERIGALMPWYLPRLDSLKEKFDRDKYNLMQAIDSAEGK